MYGTSAALILYYIHVKTSTIYTCTCINSNYKILKLVTLKTSLFCYFITCTCNIIAARKVQHWEREYKPNISSCNLNDFLMCLQSQRLSTYCLDNNQSNLMTLDQQRSTSSTLHQYCQPRKHSTIQSLRTVQKMAPIP